MEEILIAAFQFFFEVVLQVLAELPWDWFVGSRESKRDQSSKKLGWIVVSLFMGGAVGLLSILVRPNTSIRSSALRMAYLGFAPPCSAWISWLVARWLAGRGRPWIQPRLHAICAFCFALVLTALRFAYTHRPN